VLGPFVTDSASSHNTIALAHASHNLGLVVLSLLVVFTSSCAAFYMAHTNRQAAALSHRRVSLLCASMVLGLGIWAMHFIGMLAMRLPTAVQYDHLGTGLSILPGMVAAWLALWSMQAVSPSNTRILICATMVALGIGAMHYSGIAAMQLDGRMLFDLPLSVLSLLAGLVCSVVAFVCHRSIYSYGVDRLHWAWRLLPPLLISLAIASMHYISMLALRVAVQAPESSSAPEQLQMAYSQSLPLLIAAMSFVVFLILGLANALLRYRDLWKAVAVRDARLNAMIDTAEDGFITIDAKGHIQDFNPAAERIFGYSKDEIAGRNVSTLMPSPLSEQHDGHLERHIGQPSRPISVNGREVLGKRKDGRHVPLQLAIGKALTPDGTIFVGYLQDISERKRTDAQLRIAASVFHHVREGVAIVDANHNISDVNPAFLRLMEKTRESCVGRSLESLYEDADIPPDMSKLWQVVATQQYWQSEIMFTRSNGTVWMQRLSISPVLSDLQRPQHFIAVVSDVSERPSLEGMLPSAELHDSITGLPSQKLFMDRLSSGLLAARRKATHVGIMVVKVLPAQGPAMQLGNTDFTGALRLLAQLLQQQLRSTDTLARFGEDQLALLLPGIKEQQAFRALIQRLGHALHDADASYSKYGVQEILLGSGSTLQCSFVASELMEATLENMAPLWSNPNAQVHW
jgi:PAS domain S-box-containing protein/diguanylate cyclase (GGDEF)-like protein